MDYLRSRIIATRSFCSLFLFFITSFFFGSNFIARCDYTTLFSINIFINSFSQATQHVLHLSYHPLRLHPFHLCACLPIHLVVLALGYWKLCSTVAIAWSFLLHSGYLLYHLDPVLPSCSFSTFLGICRAPPVAL
ncbi:hypothetical protein CPB83DRAFT_247371 [Crepidotus variabilis]|uniref:Uncharacterized protein n=1 Tax=Crepidotus variabilis TaxID=179855 RepID=A0A9P6EIG7_9AGAR|nr:hypothetical protein CPB83DRAFT_247371 [Crepidotus variabilis]